MLLAKLAAVDEDESDQEVRAIQKRLLILVSEVNADEARRRRKRKRAQQWRRDSTIASSAQPNCRTSVRDAVWGSKI
ncbi:hypothetical protein [Paramicrobacterium fandaimingii]|uniref:hypothetical protein n=1 Tax=Paramicrobacterium fandaimingii TaxID=2708079 RepID=UPI00141FCB9F|nr:hypothetical protein [Microbacterium fandaimingii]